MRQAVAYGLEHREMAGVLYIGIDELSRQKGSAAALQMDDVIVSSHEVLPSGMELTAHSCPKLRVCLQICEPQV